VSGRLGHVDPDVAAAVPTTDRRLQALLRVIRARGFTLARLPGSTRAVHLSGPGGTSVKAADVRSLTVADLA
jgi:hypothetical protein